MELNRKTLYLGAFAYAFVLLLFLSPDSYLYDVFQRCDTAWFFMCGKAWMNGMVPYVDFADSKGPLLWLIYGCGYLLSPHSYVGVFWLSSLFYAATFVLAYRLARLFVDGKTALMVLALLPLALFWKGIHYEVRAEDFCYPFIMYCLYGTFRTVKEHDRQMFWPAFGIGVSIMCCLLIKWSVAAMLSGTALVILVYSIKYRKPMGILGGVLGLLAGFIPFLIYFLLQGNLAAFVHEYFQNTYTSVSQEPLLLVLFEKLLHHGGGRNFITKFAVVALGFLCFCRRYRFSWWICVVPIPFVLLLATPGFRYYFTVLAPLFVVAFIVIADFTMKRLPMGRRLFCCVCIAVVVCGMVYNFKRPHSLCFRPNAYRQTFYDMEALLGSVGQPKVLCFTENSVGVTVGALPACKYWALQNGATPEMHADREKALKERKADYIIISKTEIGDEVFGLSNKALADNGYVFCGRTIGEFGELNQFVYCRRELLRPIPHAQFTTMDLLLKRDI